MSGATYRIDATHRPIEPERARWCANVFRLSDEVLMFSAFGRYMDEAINEARAWIKADGCREPGVSLLVDEFGVTLKQSVKP